jgi:hypothetical protein
VRAAWTKNLALVLTILGCLAAGLGLAACGRDPDPNLTTLQKIERWATGTEQLASDAKQDGDLASGFDPKLPPASPSALKKLVPVAVEIGEEARDAIKEFGEDNELVVEEAEGLGCFLYGKVASGELPSDLESLEEFFIDYFADRFSEEVPTLKAREELETFSETIEHAQSEGEEGLDATMATVCAYRDE